MDQIEQLFLAELDKKSNFNLKKEALKYLRKWPWFLLSIGLALSIAVVKLKYTPKQYRVSTTILIKDDKKGAMVSELSAFEDIGAVIGGTRNVDNEIQVLKSRSILRAVVKHMQLNVRFLRKGRIREAELFGISKPFEVEYTVKEELFSVLSKSFTVRILSKDSFEIVNEDLETLQKGSFGTALDVGFGSCTLMPLPALSQQISEVITVVISPVEAVMNGLHGGINIGVVNKKTSVVSLSLVGTHRQKSIEILDHLVDQYNLDAINDKNEIAKNTADFIKNRLLIITEDLNTVDVDVAHFKEKNKLTDIGSEANLFLKNASMSEKELLGANTQLKLASYMVGYLEKVKGFKALVPVSLGLNNLAIEALSQQYNTLVLKRNRLLKTSSEINPVVVSINDNLIQIKENLQVSLQNLKASISIQLASLQRRDRQLRTKIAGVPKKELVYRDIQRQQQIKEALYLYLLQKREETAISLAVTVANAKIIDRAYGSRGPVSPKGKKIIVVCFLIGLFIPIVFIYLRQMLDTTIHSRDDLDGVKASFLGDIPLLGKGKEDLMVNTGTDGISEAFRILRRAVNFCLLDKKNTGNVIMLGSSISGEGKTFVALNIAASLALSGKKVLLLELDLRNPSLRKKLDLSVGKGFVNYIINPEEGWKNSCYKDIITPQLDVLLAGEIPPNPSELLMHSQVSVFFKEVKEVYDYIVVDTAPIGLVADTLEITEYADLFMYVLRSKFSDKSFLPFIKDLSEEKKVKNMGILLNAIDIKKGHGYGYGYGYGYAHRIEKEQSWYAKMFSRV